MAIIGVTAVVGPAIPVIAAVAWPAMEKGKTGRPSPPSVVIRRRRRVVTNRRGSTDFLNCFFHQLPIFPDAFSDLPAIGISRPLRNGFHRPPFSIVIDHWLAILCGIPGCLVILIYCIADQCPEDGSGRQPDERALRVASDGLADESAGTGTDGSPDLSVEAVGRIMGA